MSPDRSPFQLLQRLLTSIERATTAAQDCPSSSRSLQLALGLLRAAHDEIEPLTAMAKATAWDVTPLVVSGADTAHAAQAARHESESGR